MAFDARQDTVGKLLNNSIYRIPRNQRAYVWNEHNWKDLYDDFKLITEGVGRSHFIGSIVLKEENPEEDLSCFTVIDGQQRILTVTLLLAAITYSLKSRNLITDAEGTKKYLMAVDVKNQDKEIVYPEHHLTLPNIVRGVIDVDQKTASSTSAIAFAKGRCISKTKDDLIVKAFQYFSKSLETLDNEELLAFRNAVINASYVKITSTSDEDSYTIFEILNARGIELEDHELLKNYIMRYIHPIEKRDEAKAVWAEIELSVGDSMKDFLRHYAIHKYRFGANDKDGVYKKIRDFQDPRKVHELLYDLKTKGLLFEHH